MKKLGLLLLALLAFSGNLVFFFFTPTPPESSETTPDLEMQKEIEKKILRIDERVKEIQKEIRSRGKALHMAMNAPQAPQFFWSDDDDSAEKKKARLTSLLKIELRTLLRLVENLNQRKDELNYELEWEKIKAKEFIKKSLSASSQNKTQSVAFRCSVNPVTPLADRAAVKQPFGLYKDPETGLSWQTSGWWISEVQNQVRACAKGSVVYTGKVAGRGRVVLVDHGHGNMTLYANLSEELPQNFARGTTISAGTVLGTPLERFYFEVRKDTSPVDPKSVFSADILNHFQM